jgi:hypothetical protein
LSTDGEPTSSSIPEKSIAVLPFENLSDDKQNAFFAEEIQPDARRSRSRVRRLQAPLHFRFFIAAGCSEIESPPKRQSH